MNRQEYVSNPALCACPGTFALRDRIGLPDVQGFAQCPHPLEFHENGSVTFNLYYPLKPDAKTAELRLFCDYQGKGPATFSMKPEENGFFTVTVSDIEPGIHVFCVVLDGVPCLMPNAPMYYNGDHFTNFVDVPDWECDSYLLKDIPHGDVRTRYFYSQELGRVCPCVIYTPPEYEASGKEYPVLYLQHGGGENENGWFGVAKANFILDDLIYQSKCREMIVVCNNGFTFKDGEDYTKVSHLKNLAPMLIRDCAPYIEANFRVKKGKENRAVAGLSMGSFETLILACLYPDFADYIGVMSGPSLKPFNEENPMFAGNGNLTAAYADVEAFNRSHKLLYFSKGNQEGGKELLKDLQPYIDRGIQVETFICEGSHEFQTWRRSLMEFAPKLFQL